MILSRQLPLAIHVLLVNTVAAAIGPKGSMLSFEIKLVPEQYLVQQLFANRSDHVFNEGMGNRGVRNRLDLLDALSGILRYWILNSFAAVSPRIAMRSSSLRLGVPRM